MRSYCKLESDLGPQNHVAAWVFGSVLPVQIVAIADIVHSRVKWPDVVMVTDILDLCAQDQLTALQVEIGQPDSLLQRKVVELKAGVRKAVAADLLMEELIRRAIGHQPVNIG